MKWGARFLDAWKDLGKELKVLHRQPVFLANAWGFVPVQACLGVFTFWGPKVGLSTFYCSSWNANIALHGLHGWETMLADLNHWILSIESVAWTGSLNYLLTDAVINQAAKEILRADEDVISYLLGGITVGTAVVGTIGGGVLLVADAPTSTSTLPGSESVFHKCSKPFLLIIGWCMQGGSWTGWGPA